VKTKSYSPAENAAARQFVRRIIDDDFGGNVFQASKALKVSQSYLYEFLNEHRGGGMKLLRAAARHTGVSVDAVIGHSPGAPTKDETRFPNRGNAIDHLLEGGHGSEAEVRIAADAVSRDLQTTQDPSVESWISVISFVLRGIQQARRELSAHPAFRSVPSDILTGIYEAASSAPDGKVVVGVTIGSKRRQFTVGADGSIEAEEEEEAPASQGRPRSGAPPGARKKRARRR
jgi:hypothetical protein